LSDERPENPKNQLFSVCPIARATNFAIREKRSLILEKVLLYYLPSSQRQIIKTLFCAFAVKNFEIENIH